MFLIKYGMLVGRRLHCRASSRGVARTPTDTRPANCAGVSPSFKLTPRCPPHFIFSLSPATPEQVLPVSHHNGPERPGRRKRRRRLLPPVELNTEEATVLWENGILVPSAWHLPTAGSRCAAGSHAGSRGATVGGPLQRRRGGRQAAGEEGAERR
jgi:hypothetical protein